MAVKETKDVRKPAEAPPAKDDNPRVSLALTSDGSRIDWSKVRESRRPDVEKLLANDPRVRALVVPADAGGSVPIANKAFTDSMIEILGQIESALAMRLYGLTMEQAFSVCQFSATEKTAMADPLERIINKRASAWLMQYGDEIALGVLLLTFTRAKMSAASALANPPMHVQPPVVNEKSAGFV